MKRVRSDITARGYRIAEQFIFENCAA